MLIDMANLRGGPDNITAVVARVNVVPPSESGEPLTVSTPRPARSHATLLLWAILATSLLASCGLALSGHLTAAMAAGLVAAAVAVLAVVQKLGGGTPAGSVTLGGPFGSGPHDSHDGVPNAESVAVLRQMAQQLREAAKDEHWTLDWGRFNGHGDQANAAMVAGDCSRAVREYALAISFMMSEIRRQPTRKDRRDNSVLDF